MPIKMKCWDCGADYSYTDMTPYCSGVITEHGVSRHFCKECFERREAEREADLKEYVRLKVKLEVERAIRKLERQQLNIYDYKDSIETISEFAIENPDKFDSAPEIIAAIVLLNSAIPMYIQHKIAGYKVDFYLPTLKAVLEIDGYLHQYKREHDSKRDREIRAELGKDYEIVRIPVKYIESNAKELVDAIITLRSTKQAKRKQGLC